MKTKNLSVYIRVHLWLKAVFSVLAIANLNAQTIATAQALEARGDWKGAEAAWRALVAQAPQDYRLWTSLGIALAHEARYPAAIEAYEKALRLRPDEPQVELDLGLAYFKSGQLPRAVAPLQSAERAMGDTQQLDTLLGMSLFGTSRYREAVPYLEKAAAREPANPQMQQVLAQCYLYAGAYEKAMTEFKQMLLRDPDSPAVHILLGEAYDAQNEPAEAIAEFRLATAHGYVPDAYFGLGYLLWKERRYDEAAAAFREELKNDPKNSQALAYLGDIALRQHDNETAKRYLQQAVALRDDIRIAHFDLGVLDSDNQHYAAAIRELKRAVALSPSEPDAHYRLAHIYQSTGNQAEAQRELALVKQLHEHVREDLLLNISKPQKKPGR